MVDATVNNIAKTNSEATNNIDSVPFQPDLDGCASNGTKSYVKYTG